jgi:hypothetical protein
MYNKLNAMKTIIFTKIKTKKLILNAKFKTENSVKLKRVCMKNLKLGIYRIFNLCKSCIENSRIIISEIKVVKAAATIP